MCLTHTKTSIYAFFSLNIGQKVEIGSIRPKEGPAKEEAGTVDKF
jgi:hypothetical protein